MKGGMLEEQRECSHAKILQILSGFTISLMGLTTVCSHLP
jgi:hypothetical protein